MKHKNRVLALDYFRGLCMLIVIVNHFSYFDSPLTMLAGGGQLWVSAAELFFLISGVTYGFVRGPAVVSRFREVIKKSFKRAAMLYGLNLLCVLASLAIAFQLTGHGKTVDIPGALPSGSGSDLANIMMLRYGYGWADFLMYYTVFLALAPFALRALYSRWWPIVPLATVSLLGLTLTHGLRLNPYFYFFIWQAYFFAGMTIARFRLPILERFHSLKSQVGRRAIAGIGFSLGAGLMMISFVEAYQVKLAAHGLLPASWATGLARFQLKTDFWLGNNRSGSARLLVSLAALTSLYVLYQKFKQPIIKYSGNFVMSIGRNSLQVFILQALTIPLVAALPLRNDNALTNAGLTIMFIYLMWLFSHKLSPLPAIRKSFASCYSSLIAHSYLVLNSLRDLRNWLSSSFELDN
jgi:hypothetical protein